VRTEPASKDSPEAGALLDVMHAHSEERCAASWHVGQEFYLWSAVTADGRWPEAQQAQAWEGPLRDLAEAAGGWWVHGGPEGRTFLPLDAWRKRYAERLPGAPEPDDRPWLGRSSGRSSDFPRARRILQGRRRLGT
jgi:hypothetical protein